MKIVVFFLVRNYLVFYNNLVLHINKMFRIVPGYAKPYQYFFLIHMKNRITHVEINFIYFYHAK